VGSGGVAFGHILGCGVEAHLVRENFENKVYLYN